MPLPVLHAMYARQYKSEPNLRLDLQNAIKCCNHIFQAINYDAYLERPIPLRNQLIFYYGHLPAFAWNQTLRGALRRDAFNSAFDRLFERGIDPPESSGQPDALQEWPSLSEIDKYKLNVEDQLFDLNFDDERINSALCLTLEHYWMHAETLMYMIHQLAEHLKNPLPYIRLTASAVDDYGALIEIPSGVATLGVDPNKVEFAWCNEFGEHQVHVSRFLIDKYKVTNAAFLEFVESNGYERQQLWDAASWDWLKATGHNHPQFWFKQDGQWCYRDVFENIPLPLDWPVYVTQAEATAYARSKGAELPSEEEFHRAAYGTKHQANGLQPWRQDSSLDHKGNFGFRSLSPAPVGAFPAGTSEFGVCDLIGNGWEWTRTIFAPFAGFQVIPTYPGYSADFFDSRHYVMKGASPVTADRLVRRSFRNWFRPRYPYVYSSFRCIYR